MISRVLGLLRDVLMAMALGTGFVADAFYMAWLLPNLARRLFGEGAFAAALMPVFIEQREQGQPAAGKRLINAATTRLAGLLILLVLLGEGCLALARSAPGRQLAAACGLHPAALLRADLAMSLAQVLLPYLAFICLAGVLGGALNALNRFAVPAAAPVVLNVLWIVGLLGANVLVDGQLSRVQALVWVLVGAGAIQLLMHTAAMGRADHPVRPAASAADPSHLRRVRTLFWTLGLGLAVFQLNVMLDNLIAFAFVAEGGVSALYYANRLAQLPIGVLGVALSTAVFPELTRRAKRQDMGGLGQLLDRGVRIGAFVALPACVGLAVLAQPIVSTLFERGAFDAVSTARTARVLLFLAPSVLTACVTPVITRGFYAQEDVRLPVRISAACVVLNLTLNLLLVGPLQEAGLALATSISQITNLVALVVCSRRRRRSNGDVPATAETLRAVTRYALAAGVMGAAALIVHSLLPGPSALRLTAAIVTGVVVYAGSAWVSRAPELRALLAR
jgi:putative peptidoglycan lipid II flippase